MFVSNTLTYDHILRFEKIIGNEFVIVDADLKDKYAYDETADFYFLPDVVLKPRTTGEISEILKICNQDRIPVTPRGAGTGLSGGAIAQYGGVVLSVERMNSILHIDEENQQVTTEPGVITQTLQDAVKAVDLFYPPDPHSRGSCFIGGNIAENSGGPKAVKYGVVKDYVLNLEIVLATGEILYTGANVLKNATGYNLTQLIVGSEGTLAIVTKIVLKLIKMPKHDLCVLASFSSPENACSAVNGIFKSGYVPSAIEFMDRNALEYTSTFVYGSKSMLSDRVQSQLVIEVDGNDMEVLIRDIEGIATILGEYGIEEIQLGESNAQKENLWRLRRCVGEAIRSVSVYKEQDTVVPRSELPALIKGIGRIAAEYGFKTACCGHAGDGNLHVNILKGDLSEEQWNSTVKKAVRELFILVKSLGGTISAEHGIGLLQKQYMDVVFDSVQMKIMKRIKEVFDPNGILNAGKIFDINN